MWEAIAANRRRSIFLIFLMALLLVLLGAAIGAAALGGSAGSQSQSGGVVFDPGVLAFGAGAGALVAGIVFLGMMGVAFAGGDGIVLRSAGAREIDHSVAPQLWNVVEEMQIASGLGRMPRIYIMEDSRPNAFAVGRNPEKPTIAVTSGLMKRLDRDELQGVVAHEVGHIVNQDVRFMTYAAVLMGSIVMLSQVFLRGMFHASHGRRRTSRREGGGGAQAILLIIAVVVAILAPIMAQLLYFACSRRREYLADACGARFTRYPEGLASALEKISAGAASKGEFSKVAAPMCTVNPLQAAGASGAFSTHPPTDLRIRILRGMGGGADYASYENAWRQATGDDKGLIGRKTLDSAGETVAAREASADREAAAKGGESTEDRARQVAEILDRVGNFLVLGCACGMRIKIPPEMKADSLECPRCGRHHEVPTAQREAVEAIAGATAMHMAGRAAQATAQEAAEPEVLRYRRRTDGWETFQCGRCADNVQLSPAFAAPRVRCGNCGADIEIQRKGTDQA